MDTHTRAESTAGEHLNLTWNEEQGSQKSSGLDAYPVPDSFLEKDDAPVSTADDRDVDMLASAEENIAEKTEMQAEELPAVAEERQAVPAEEVSEDVSENRATPSPSPAVSPAPVASIQAKSVRQPKVYDLTQLPSEFGPALRSYREKAGMDVPVLCQRLNMEYSSLFNLEAGDFSDVKDLFFAKRQTKRILRLLQVSSDQTEHLLELLEKDYQAASKNRFIRHIPIAEPIEGGQAQRGVWMRIMRHFPALILSVVMLALLIILLLAVVIPLVNKYRGRSGVPRLDVAPLVKPLPPQPVLFQ